MKSGIKPLDALHLSCAINAEADYFITVDEISKEAMEQVIANK